MHHGNGTEECVRWLIPGLDSIDLLRGDCFGRLNTPRYKPWLDGKDADNVLFVSVHGFGPRERGMEHLMPAAAFYPGSGRTCLPMISTEKEIEERDGSSVKVDEEGINGGELMVTGKAVHVSSARDIPKDSPVEKNDEVAAASAELEDDGAGSDDDDDDDDYGDEEEGDGNNDDDDDEGVDYELPADGKFSRGSAKLLQLRRTYTPHLNSSSSHDKTPTAKKKYASSSLILDVGIPMAEEDIESDPLAAASYRSLWRNQFRWSILPIATTYEHLLIIFV